MKNVVNLWIVLAIVAGILTFINWPDPTPEEIAAKAEMIKAEAQLKQAEADARALEIQAQADADQKAKEEAHRRHLEEEAAKTPEQKAIEAKNEEMSIGEGAAAVARISSLI